MKNLCFIFLLGFIFCTFSFGQNKVSEIVGTYQFCPYECESIKINADFTFDYFIEGHIGSSKRTKGTWKFIGRNEIHTESPKRELINEVNEIIGDSNETTIVTVSDITGALFPGITIKFLNEGKSYMVQTDEEGSVNILKTDEIEISYLQYSAKYKIENKNASKLKISITPLIEPWIDSNFKVKKGEICRFVDNDEFSDFCHKKLSNKKAKKIFPKQNSK